MSVVSDTELTQRVQDVLEQTYDDLLELVRIPSVSSLPAHNADVEATAERLVDMLKALNIDDVKTVSESGKPAVIGHFHVDDDLPTVLLYSHYDVQPTGDLAAWTSDPFTPTERNGRLYGRGPADDKGGLASHFGALRAFDGQLPVNVTVLFEGEEELGSPTLAAILEKHKKDLAADVYVIADCGNWAPGQPAFTTTLRGVTDLVVKVSTLDHGLHSGEFGGPLPDAVTTLCRLIATLHDEDGNVAVNGLVQSNDTNLDYSETRLRAESGVLDGVKLLGSGPIGARTWLKPSISVIGIDTTCIKDSANLLIPTASAKISIRLAPGDNSDNVLDQVEAHLRAHNDWGAHLEITRGESAQPSVLPQSGPIYDLAKRCWQKAFGVEPVPMGTGGSIGMIADFQKAYPKAFILGCGVADPDSRMHGIDESLTISDFEKACLAEAFFLNELGR